MSPADEAKDGLVVVPPGLATPLADKSTRCTWVTLWRVPCDLGVGGASLDTNQHLEAGTPAYTARIGDLAGLYVFHRESAAVQLRFTYGV